MAHPCACVPEHARFPRPARGYAGAMGRNRIRRAVVAVVAGGGLLLTGAAACEGSGPGVSDEGEQGDVDNDFGTGGDSGAGNEGEGEPGEGGAGDEVGGGG